jgi:hypothetical protein
MGVALCSEAGDSDLDRSFPAGTTGRAPRHCRDG